jgi:DNA-binding transcriptional ArsR family regulator
MLDPDFLAAIGHSARLRALVLLEGRPASSRELAEEIGLTHSAMAYHVRKLSEAGLIEAVDTRQRRAFEENVWRTKAKGWVRLARLLAEISQRTQASRAARARRR